MNNQGKRFAVIFDCDGVMFDSKQANINYYNHILNHFSLPLMSAEEEDYVHMNTADGSVRAILEGTPYFEEAQEYRKGLDYTPFIEYMVIEPGLKDLLRELKPKFCLAVSTNRGNTIEKVLETYGLNGIFDIVVSSQDVKRPKPDPESINKILDFLGIDFSRAYFVGDSYIDYQAARAAGVKFISYKNQDLEAEHIVNSMHELIAVLQKNIERG
jgi:HAD superfamily hydrolase (TIGR01509 family)